jgi:uncharacterized membrane protein
LLVLADKPPFEGNWFDARGELRVWMPALRLDRLIKLAFDQIRQASATTPAVLIRQLDMIRRLAPRVDGVAIASLAEQIDAILETATIVALDRRDLEAAATRARDAVQVARAA